MGQTGDLISVFIFDNRLESDDLAMRWENFKLIAIFKYISLFDFRAVVFSVPVKRYPDKLTSLNIFCFF